ncbi:glycoside hydrolase 5 family protein [Spelaeicoccus albus]|uniref:Glycosyl hydrolase n=1 Tax=Spelaeicoccus albus TaxID=1280376 RepID=A0A7Z0CZW2_9MICO|nr:glycosyl hydrolase [Spelaeicoccus albus]NYI66731.1 hypothetical protein [Spelaeicoccus albus]
MPQSTPQPPSPRWGVNYTPRNSWFHSWLDLNLDDVRADFDAIAGLGVDHVRIFPLWPILQPSRSLINAKAVGDVGRVIDAAAERGLDVAIDALQGHLSSFDFLPSWTRTWHRRNIFTDPAVVAAQADLITALGRAAASRPNVIGLTVGNETNQFSAGRHPDPDAVTTGQMSEWLGRMLDASRSGQPAGMHQHSFDDEAFFNDTSAVTPSMAGRIGDTTAVHSWVFTGVARHYGAGHPAVPNFADYLVQLGSAWSGPGRPVWLQEIGAPAPIVPATDAAGFLDSSIRNTMDSPGLWGVTWWCSHDVDRGLADFPELEYSLGLIDSGGAVKPAGAAFAELIADQRAHPVPPRPRTVAVAFDDAESQRSLTAPGGPVLDTWIDLVRGGIRPTLVRSSLATDAAHLAARGVTEVVSAR